METRKSLGDREVIAPTVKPHSKKAISKNDFEIDVKGDRVRCPMGQETSHWTWTWVTPGRGRPRRQVKRFTFAKEVCRACPRYEDCVTDKRRRGRSVTLHPRGRARPHEERLQEARAFERTEYFREVHLFWCTSNSIESGWWWSIASLVWCNWASVKAAT